MDNILMRKKSRILIKTFLFLLAIMACALTGAKEVCFAEDKIVAIVNNEVITQKDVDDFINFMRVQISQQTDNPREIQAKLDSVKSDVVKRLVEDRLIVQEAKKLGVPVDDNKVKARVDVVRKKYPSEQAFIDSLKNQGITLSDLEARVRDQLLMYILVDNKIKNKITVNPSEVTEFYQTNLSKFNTGEEREFLVATSKDQKAINDFYAQVSKGKDFNEAADKLEISVDKIVTSQKGQLDKSIEDLIFSMKESDISQPKLLKDTYYCFKLQKIMPPKQETLAEVQEEIYDFLYNKKMQDKMIAWVDELKKTSYIQMF